MTIMIFIKKMKKLPKDLTTVCLMVIMVLAPANMSLGSTNVTNSFQVNTTVVASCSVSAATLAFPNYSLVQDDGSTTVTVTCTNTTPYTLGLSAGTGSGATVTTRKMTNGANTLNYSLYSDSARATVWGDVAGSGLVTGLTGTGSAQNYTVYGRIPAGQAPVPGTYTDTITVTATF